MKHPNATKRSRQERREAAIARQAAYDSLPLDIKIKRAGAKQLRKLAPEVKHG